MLKQAKGVSFTPDDVWQARLWMILMQSLQLWQKNCSIKSETN